MTLHLAASFGDAVFARLDLWWVCLAVLVVIAAELWGVRQRASALAALGDPALVRRLVAVVHPGLRFARVAATSLAVVCASVALLRLQYGGVATVVPAGGLDVVLVVDYSKSMLVDDVYPSRNERLEAELDRFLEEADRRGDRVGLVVFAGAPRGLPLSRDMRLLRLYLDKADPRTEEPGGTAIGPALNLALEFLREARLADAEAETHSDQVIILLTDGEDTVSKPLVIAKQAADLGVRVYTVGIGSRSGVPIPKLDERGLPAGIQTDDEGAPVMARLDDATLRRIAEITRGAYVEVRPEAFGLAEVRELMRDLTRAQREDTLEIQRQEGFALLLTPAVVLLALALLLGDGRRPAGAASRRRR